MFEETLDRFDCKRSARKFTFVGMMPDDFIEASENLSRVVTERSTMESGHRDADGITLSIRTTNISDNPPDVPASPHGSEHGRTAEQDDSAVDHMADHMAYQPRYPLQHVDPSLIPGLSEALRQMAGLTKFRLYFEVVGGSVSAVNTERDI